MSMSEFKNLAKLFLVEGQGDFERCSTQLNLTKGKKAILRIAKLIREEHLHEYGREESPHITVLENILPSLTAENSTQAALSESGISEIRAVVGDCSVFSNKDYDVLKFEVLSEDLHKVNSHLNTLIECGGCDDQEHSEYNPHITVAYLRKGIGAQYAEKFKERIAGLPLSFNNVVFSDTRGKQTNLTLGYPDNADAKHPNTGDYLEEDLGVGGGNITGGTGGGAFMSGHLATYSSPDLSMNPNSFRAYRRGDMQSNNTIVSGYYDTIFDDDVRKIMAILRDLGFEVSWPKNDDGEKEFHLMNTKDADQTHTQTSQDDIGSSDDVMDYSSGINLSKETILKHLRSEFGKDLASKAEEASGEVTYDDILMGLKEAMRMLKYPDKDYATMKVLKTLIDDPK